MVRRTILLTAVLTLVASACTTTRTQTLSLVKQIEGITIEVNQAVADLFDTLDQPYDTRAQLYERLLDLRLPSTFAVLRDKASRFDAPPGTEAELDRYVEFLGELLLASEALDFAIATEDPAAIAVSAIVVEVAVGALAVALPAASCTPLTPRVGRDLCEPDGLDGYEADLGFEIRRFVASFRPAFRVPDAFGDVIRGRVLATVQSDAARVLDATASRIDALDPGTAYARVHQVLLDYFPAAGRAWAEYQADAGGSDPLIYGSIIASLEEERAATQQLLEEQYELVLSALPNSQIESIIDIWFAPMPDPNS